MTDYSAWKSLAFSFVRVDEEIAVKNAVPLKVDEIFFIKIHFFDEY